MRTKGIQVKTCKLNCSIVHVVSTLIYARSSTYSGSRNASMSSTRSCSSLKQHGCTQALNTSRRLKGRPGQPPLGITSSTLTRMRRGWAWPLGRSYLLHRIWEPVLESPRSTPWSTTAIARSSWPRNRSRFLSTSARGMTTKTSIKELCYLKPTSREFIGP